MPISAPILSVVDAADGTGGTVALVSGDSLATNVVYSQNVNGELGTANWVSQGSRIGNGSLTLSMTPGYYWFYVVSTKASDIAVSNLVYQNLTDGEDPVMEQLLLAVQARIQGLLLEKMPNNHVLILKVPTENPADVPEGDNPYPMTMIMPFGQEEEGTGTNIRDDIRYPILVMLIDADMKDQQLNRKRYLRWRQQVYRAFRNQPLVGVDATFSVKVQPQAILDPAAWYSSPGRFISSLTIMCTNREVRGI